MARLALHFNLLRAARRADIRRRNGLRRMARFTGDAFSCDDEEFYKNYRINKEMFQALHEELVPFMPRPKRSSEIHTKYKLLVALSFFATGSYQRLVGGTQGTFMSQQSVSRCIQTVVAALSNDWVYKKYICFPQTREERENIKRRFYEKFKMPGVIGAIDGTHVAIIRPSQHEERYFNRKHYHSINVLLICDADLNILCLDPTFGGASHDSHIWNQYPVKLHIEQLVEAGENVYILGDSGYAQRKYLMTPIVDATAGSPEEYYTKLQMTARNTVERTFGVLKNRWRCLLGHRVLHYSPTVAARIIYACCVLHNICNKRQFGINELPIEDYNVPAMPQEHVDQGYQGAQEELRQGLVARARLVNNLWLAR